MTLALLALAAASSAGTACLFLICEPIEDLSYRDRRQEKDGDVSSPARGARDDAETTVART